MAFIPNVGMFCSQRGNISFPTWEYFLSNVKISERLARSAKKVLSLHRIKTKLKKTS